MLQYTSIISIVTSGLNTNSIFSVFFFTIPNLSFKIHSNAFFVEVKSVSKIN